MTDDPFTEAYLGYLPTIRGLVARILGNSPIDPEDVLQQIWINGSRGWPRVRDPKVFRGWIGRISINAAYEAMRRERKHVPGVFDSDGNPVEAADEAVQDDDVLKREIRDAIAEDSVRHPRRMEILRLVRIFGYTYLEASRILGIAEGTAKSEVFRATAHLRQSLTAPKAA